MPHNATRTKRYNMLSRDRFAMWFNNAKTIFSNDRFIFFYTTLDSKSKIQKRQLLNLSTQFMFHFCFKIDS